MASFSAFIHETERPANCLIIKPSVSLTVLPWQSASGFSGRCCSGSPPPAFPTILPFVSFVPSS